MISKVLTLFICILSLCSCFSRTNNADKQNKISLTFEQHEYLGWLGDVKEPYGYRFGLEALSTTVFEYEYNHELTREEVGEFFSGKGINFDPPMVTNWGYLSFTNFVLNFDVDTGCATLFLMDIIPFNLTNNLVVYFGVYD